MSVPVQFVRIRDRDGEVAIGRDDLVRYAGPGQVVASALSLRLFARAFADLSPDEPPHRDWVRVLTAFPGQGMLDCIEMITRASSRGCLVVDPEAGPADAPPAAPGRFHFVVAVGAQARAYSLAPGFFTSGFLDQVGRLQDRPGTPEDQAAYQQAKHALIGRLLGTPDEVLFRASPAGVPAARNDRTIVVLDHGVPLTIGFEDCVKFHGRTSIGGAALGFRLMQRAFADLSPGRPPERATIGVRTAFPGLGVRDAVELIARADSRGAYVVDTECAPASAPEAAFGRLWFEVTIAGSAAAYAAPSGAMSEEFIALARRSYAEGLSPEEAIRWQALKEQLAETLLRLTPATALISA